MMHSTNAARIDIMLKSRCQSEDRHFDIGSAANKEDGDTKYNEADLTVNEQIMRNAPLLEDEDTASSDSYGSDNVWCSTVLSM